jgi:hypothetical protein
MKLQVIEKSKPKGVKAWIAVKLVRLAQYIHPESDAVKAFYTQCFIDEMIYGQFLVRVNPEEVIINDKSS